ncbi:MAG: 1,4-alpha-glucan branching enzyme, partial [Desulfurivibrionaceae bacterium]
MKKEHRLISDYDLHLLSQGTHYRSWEKLGAHIIATEDGPATHFALWAPNAERVSVIGDFNDWDGAAHPMERIGESGYWQNLVPKLDRGALYKYEITSRHNNFRTEKTDPFAFFSEIRPATASIVWDLGGYEWGDREWLASR